MDALLATIEDALKDAFEQRPGYMGKVAAALRALEELKRVNHEAKSQIYDALYQADPIVTRAVARVAVERTAQDEQWGGPAHDDTHTGTDWLEYVGHQLARANKEFIATVHDHHGKKLTVDQYKVLRDQQLEGRYAKIAALGLAALQSLYRKGLKKDAPEVKGRVYHREDCAFNYCPSPGICENNDRCQHPSVNT